ncbi:MAG: hypothetical protein JJ879_03155 [Sneathiella sp.]|nr:hypothetical protein [Sneathiella sp.]
MRGLAILGAACFLAACSGPTSYLYKTEKALGTEAQATKIMHSGVDFPRGLSLSMPGYVIGIEKAPRKLVTTERWQTSPRAKGEAHPRIPEGERRTNILADSLYTDSKAHIVTHIMKYDVTKSPISAYQRVKGCALYNLYEQDLADAKIQCERYLPALPEGQYTKAFDYSWNALDQFKSSLLETLSGPDAPTHVVVYVMGWNTPQIEAYRNFNSLAGHMLDAAEADASNGRVEFRPLVVGVTWPSLWRNLKFVPDLIAHPISYRNKANDADEVGMSWLGVLLHDVLVGVRNQVDREQGRYIPIIAVGHSFGARAVTRGVFTGPAIAPNPETAPIDNYNRVADLVIGLQGAFSKNRFHPKGGKGEEDQPYDHFRDQAGQTLLTASRHDSVIGLSFWSETAGNDDSWNDECKAGAVSDNPLFNCQNVAEKSEFLTTLRNLPRKACIGNDPTSCRIQYVRMDPIVRFNAAETGGGAHSDIYRAPIGQLTWEMIKKYAPGGGIQRPPTASRLLKVTEK